MLGMEGNCIAASLSVESLSVAGCCLPAGLQEGAGGITGSILCSPRLASERWRDPGQSLALHLLRPDRLLQPLYLDTVYY